MIALVWAFAQRLGGAGWRLARRDPVVVAALVLVVVNLLLVRLVHQAHAAFAEEHLVALNAASALDTSEQVRGVQAAQLTAVTRQLAQVSVARDSLDRLLHLVPLAKARVEIVMPPTTIHATADSSRAGDGGRIVSFDLRQTPFTAHADVAVPDDTTHAPSIQLGIALDSAELQARVGCVGDTARVVFTAPPWLPLRVTGGAQDPRLCQHVAPAIATRPRRWHLTIGPGYGVGPTGHHGAGLFAVVGWSPF